MNRTNQDTSMANVHRLKTSEKIFFITSNLKPGVRSFHELEYQIIAETIVSNMGGWASCSLAMY
jgi:hypothetical protein